MLDIGFPELLLVTLVILLVFGPERLPEVLRTLGGWIGQARRSFSSLKTEIEREIGADEIRRDIHNSRILEEAAKVRDDIKHAGADMRASKEEVDSLMRKRMAALQAEDQAASDALPESALPEAALPEAALPEAALPQTALPEAALPKTAAPETEADTAGAGQSSEPGTEPQREQEAEKQTGSPSQADPDQRR